MNNVNDIWNINRLYYAIVDICAEYAKLERVDRISWNGSVRGRAGRYKVARINAALKAFGLFREEYRDGYRSPIENFANGYCCRDTEVPELESVIRSLLNDEISGRFKDEALPMLLLPDYYSRTFRVLFSSRIEAEKLRRRFNCVMECSLTYALTLCMVEDTLFSPVRDCCKKLDTCLLKMLGKEDVSFTVEELQKEYGYPLLTDEELERIEISEYD